MEKNKRSKRNKKILAGAGALACIALLAGTYAWLQSEDNKTNKFTGVLSGNDVTITEQWKEPESWTPGQEVTKKVGIMNTGEYDEFIRVSFKEALALLTNTTVQESPTLPTIVPSFFDPIDPETAFFGFAVEFNTNENGKLTDGQPVLKNVKTTNKNNDLDAFKNFLKSYYGVDTSAEDFEFKTTGDGTAAKPYKLDYAEMGMTTPAPNAGWLIPVAKTTIDNLTDKDGSNWSEVHFTGEAPEMGSYTLVAFGSPFTDIKNPNNGEMEHIRDYKFYWTTPDPLDNSKTLYFQAAGIKQTETEYNKTTPLESTVAVLDTPKMAYISAKYNATQEKQWWETKDSENAAIGQLVQPWAKTPAPGTYPDQTFNVAGMTTQNPVYDPATGFANEYWKVNSNVLPDPAVTTGQNRAKIAINFVNMVEEADFNVGTTAQQKWQYNKADGYFYYLDIVKSGQTTKDIIQSVKLLDDADNAYTKLHYNLDVHAEAIQAIGKAAEDNWKVPEGLQGLYNALEKANTNKTNP